MSSGLKTAIGDELTARQAEILNVIKRGIIRDGVPPSVREIGEAAGIRSPNGVLCHLKALRKKGAITWNPDKSRSIRVLGDRVDDDGWIACSVMLPSRNGRFLVYDPSDKVSPMPAVSFYSKNEQMFYGGCPGVNCRKVTHWMPLPALPGKDA